MNRGGAPFVEGASDTHSPDRPDRLMPSTRLALLLAGLLLALGGTACTSSAPPAGDGLATLPEQSVRLIPLDGPLAAADAEVSGLAWLGDWLIVLPQFPRRDGTQTEGRLYAIGRAQIEQSLAAAAPAPITPRPIPLAMADLDAHTPTFQGLEAIAFADTAMYVLVEATGERGMRSYVLQGAIAPDLSRARLDAASAQPVPVGTDLANMSTEALFVRRDTIVVLHEANGAAVHPRPTSLLFDRQLRPLGPRPFPTVEYRITDATAPDSAGRFWAVNYFFPGERDVLRPQADSIALQHGTGASHRRSDVVERLVAFRMTPRGVARTPDPPVLLALAADGDGRNWEGAARWGGRGFLLATDRFPRTMLAFVPHPGRAAPSPTGR